MELCSCETKESRCLESSYLEHVFTRTTVGGEGFFKYSDVPPE